jgi:hypothetical protein
MAIGEFDGKIGALAELAGGIGILTAGPAHLFERLEPVQIARNCWRKAESMRARASSSSVTTSLIGLALSTRTLADRALSQRYD